MSKSKKPDVRKPAPAAQPAPTPAPAPAAPEAPEAKPKPAPQMSDAQALSTLLELVDRAALAGAFADLGPQGWGVIKQARERVATLAVSIGQAK